MGLEEQQDLGQVNAPDFGHLVCCTGALLLSCPQAQAASGRRPPGTPGALLRRGLADFLNM
jgi:hypothetical protein